MPDQTKPFQIESNASKYASGAVLTQLDSNGDRHPVAFLSKTFNETKKNYEIYNRELLAIIWALEEWQHYIQGSGHTTTIYSNHQPYLLPECSEVEQETDSMVALPLRIQCQTDPPSGIKNGPI